MTDTGAGLRPLETIASRILWVRDRKVMIDADLAALYGVPTRTLNQAVKRNRERFPGDFMFQLNAGEKREVITNCDHLAKLKFSKGLPFAFTEHGALMAASVLNTAQAVEVSVYVVRAFVQLRELLGSNQLLAAKVEELERKLDTHDKAIVGLLNTLRELMQPREPPKNRPIGFVIDENGGP